MHWAVILTVLTLTMVSTVLTTVLQWPVFQAFATVAGVALGLLFLIIIIVLVLATPNEQKELVYEFKKTVRADIIDLFRILGLPVKK